MYNIVYHAVLPWSLLGSTELTDKHDAELKQTLALFIHFPGFVRLNKWIFVRLVASFANLSRKLSFMNTAATPFAGKNLLDQLSTSCKSELLDLLYALELVGTDADRCKGLELVYGREWVVALMLSM